MLCAAKSLSTLETKPSHVQLPDMRNDSSQSTTQNCWVSSTCTVLCKINAKSAIFSSFQESPLKQTAKDYLFPAKLVYGSPSIIEDLCVEMSDLVIQLSLKVNLANQLLTDAFWNTVSYQIPPSLLPAKKSTNKSRMPHCNF